MIIRSRAPLRLGLAGGGTDVSPYCERFGGAVLNATIDMYAHTTIEETGDGVTTFKATDLGDDPLDLHHAVYQRVVKEFGEPNGCNITTYCDAPPGSGLGTSSTVVVSLLKAFVEWLNLPLGEYDIAHLAYEIERNDAGLSGGQQDQYAATFGGVNFMEFSGSNVIVNPLRIKNWVLSELESSIVLFNCGVSRSSAQIINEQIANISGDNSQSIDAMHEMKADAYGMKECLLKGNIAGLAEFMRKSWYAKKRAAKNITTPLIDAIHDTAISAGALAGKVSGAGGGGVMTLLVDPARRLDVVRALQTQPGHVMPCHFTKRGTEGWKITG